MPGNSINVELRDEVSPTLDRASRALRSPRLRAVMGRAIANALVANFEMLDQERHRNETGVRFYAGAARSVQAPRVEGDNVVIAVTQEGVAQRYYGGTILPKDGKKYLTIPAIPAALGRRAGSFTNLRFVFFKGKDLAALVSADPKRVRFKGGPKAKKERSARLVPQEDGRLPVVYWLKTSVTQKPDPSVIPDEETLAATAYEHGAEYLLEAAAIEGGTAAP